MALKGFRNNPVRIKGEPHSPFACKRCRGHFVAKNLVMKLTKFSVFINSILQFFTFCYPCNGGESLVFGRNFGDRWIYTLWGHPNPKITLLTFGLCVCVCVCVCVSVISITQKHITIETPNLVFYLYVTYRCFLKIFKKIG